MWMVKGKEKPRIYFHSCESTRFCLPVKIPMFLPCQTNGSLPLSYHPVAWLLSLPTRPTERQRDRFSNSARVFPSEPKFNDGRSLAHCCQRVTLPYRDVARDDHRRDVENDGTADNKCVEDEPVPHNPVCCSSLAYAPDRRSYAGCHSPFRSRLSYWWQDSRR